MPNSARIVHAKVVTVPDDGTSPVGTDEWNAGHVLTGLDQIDNTSDVNKPVSTAQAAADALVASNAATATALKANIASPAFTGTPTAPTAAFSTNTTQIATTAFVLGQAFSGTPNMDGAGSGGTSNFFSRSDHSHPTDTSRAPLASPAFTGVPTAPTATALTNSTQLATTAYADAADALHASLAGNNAFASTTASTSTTTGALTVAGGVGVGGALNIGGTFSSYNATVSGSISTVDVAQNWSAVNPLNLLATFSGYGDLARFVIRTANGTIASPSAILSGSNIGALQFRGYPSTGGWGATNNAQIQAMAAENFTSTQQGTSIALLNVLTGSLTVQTSVKAWGSGGVSVLANTDPGAGVFGVYGAIQIGSFTVATLPSAVNGRQVYCSNMRVFNGAGTLEGAGAGTGGMATYNGAWKIAGTNITASA